MSAQSSPSSQVMPISQSANQRTFNGEIAIHFPGLEGLGKPIVWVFPKVLVCLICGFMANPKRKFWKYASVPLNDVPLGKNAHFLQVNESCRD